MEQRGGASTEDPGAFNPGGAAFIITSSNSFDLENAEQDELISRSNARFSPADMKRQAFLRQHLRTAVPAPRLTVKGMEESWEQGDAPDPPLQEKPKPEGNIFGKPVYPKISNAATRNRNAPSSGSPKRRRNRTRTSKDSPGGLASSSSSGSFGSTGMLPTTTARRSMGRSPSAIEHERVIQERTAFPVLEVFPSPLPVEVQWHLAQTRTVRRSTKTS
jgi:hypothetical protein